MAEKREMSWGASDRERCMSASVWMYTLMTERKLHEKRLEDQKTGIKKSWNKVKTNFGLFPTTPCSVSTFMARVWLCSEPWLLSVCVNTGQSIQYILPIYKIQRRKQLKRKGIKLDYFYPCSPLVWSSTYTCDYRNLCQNKEVQVGSFCWIQPHKTNLPVFCYFRDVIYSAFWVSVNESCDDGVWTHSWSCERAGFCFSHSMTSLLQLSTAPLCWIHHLGAFILLELPYFFSKVQLNIFSMDFFVMQNIQFVCLPVKRQICNFWRTKYQSSLKIRKKNTNNCWSIFPHRQLTNILSTKTQ